MEDLSILSHFECFPFVNPNLCLKNHAVLISDSGQAWTHNYSWYNSVYSPIFGIRLCFKYYPIIITESNTFMYSKCHGVFFSLRHKYNFDAELYFGKEFKGRIHSCEYISMLKIVHKLSFYWKWHFSFDSPV